MGFKVIPTEIKRIYDIFNDTDVSWPECVDLSMFIVADNELEQLGDDIFPDVNHSELEDVEAPNYSGQFRGLETLDLHNYLLELLLGFKTYIRSSYQEKSLTWPPSTPSARSVKV
jgi:hypothetical protein